MSEEITCRARHQGQMEAVRRLREPEWQQIANYFKPTKNFLVDLMKGQSLPRYVQTSVPQKALMRFGFMFMGLAVDNVKPFLLANPEQGLIRKGRDPNLTDESRDYLNRTSWLVFNTLMSNRSGFLSALARFSAELAAFGTGIIWVGRKPGTGPIYMSRPLRNCWIDIDAEDRVNTLHYQYKRKLWELKEDFPDTWQNSKALRDADASADKDKADKEFKILHCVYPRAGGKYGAVADNKPFAELTFVRDAMDDEDEPLQQGGYDDFPYAVTRLQVSEGNPYGQGLAWQALPDAIMLNQLLGMVEATVGNNLAPPIAMPQRVMGKVKRGWGSINYYDAAALRFQSIKDAIVTLPVGGNPQIGVDYMKLLAQNIEDAFLVDWMRPSEHSGETATAVNDRRQLRALGVSGFMPELERGLFVPIGDRTLDIMAKENMLPVPPDQLSGVDVDWEVRSPLAMAQRQSLVDGINRVINMATQAAGIKPENADAIDFDHTWHIAGDALGLPAPIIRSYGDMAKMRAKQAHDQEMQQQAAQAAQGAAAMRDAGQGVQNVAQVANPQMQAA